MAILNAVGFLLLFNATEKFHDFIINLIQLTKTNDKEIAQAFLKIYKRKFLGYRTLLFGLGFSLINVYFAFEFGISYWEASQYFLLSTFLGIFLPVAIGIILEISKELISQILKGMF